MLLRTTTTLLRTLVAAATWTARYVKEVPLLPHAATAFDAAADLCVTVATQLSWLLSF